MIREICLCLFMLLAIVYTFSNVVKAIYKENVTSMQILLMAVGIVGVVACLFIF